MTRVFCITLALLSSYVHADDILIDFENGLPDSVRFVGIEPKLRDAPAPQGQRYIELVRKPDAPASYVVLPLPEGANLSRSAALRFRARPDDDAPTAPLELRWLALDDGNRPLFQRRLTIDHDSDWQDFREPLPLWRWDNHRTGDWRDVRRLALRIETPSGQVLLDDVRLEAGTRGEASSVRSDDDLIRLAFGDRPVRRAGGDGLLVATDQVERFNDADVESIRLDMLRARRLIARVFGTAVRTTNPEQSVALLIFDTPDSERLFHESLGKLWRAQIVPPRSGGYTVQDISTSSWNPRYGVKRPVYLHETVHGLLSRDLRLLTGHAPHTWLHEGFASYVQVALYPHSISADVLARGFKTGIGQPDSEFVPLEELFRSRVQLNQYPQALSVVSYLLENQPQLLRDLATALSDGKTVAEVLEDRGMTLQQLQESWLKWGKAHYRPDMKRVVALPDEWK
jgi:hypothetical protein